MRILETTILVAGVSVVGLKIVLPTAIDLFIFRPYLEGKLAVPKPIYCRLTRAYYDLEIEEAEKRYQKMRNNRENYYSANRQDFTGFELRDSDSAYLLHYERELKLEIEEYKQMNSICNTKN